MKYLFFFYVIITLTACQNTLQENNTLADPVIMTDPVVVHSYQLPIFPDGANVITSYQQTQSQTEDMWFWSELENSTYQKNENLIVQIISGNPIKQPPAFFAFQIPTDQAQNKYNALGPYQLWTKTFSNGDSCTYTRQYSRKDNEWLSIFIHYCTPDNSAGNSTDNSAWLNNLKPSFYFKRL